MILPPGTILQQMYLKERLRGIEPGRFTEIGVGHGVVSSTLLGLGWQGTGYDLNADSLRIAAGLNQEAIDTGRYRLVHKDWLADEEAQRADLIVSCMVLEHLDEAAEGRYFDRCRSLLTERGRGVLFVPGCPEYWGIEDEIAGHFRRYTFEKLGERIEQHDLHPMHMAGLTYPVSNMLFPVSEYLVRRKEGDKSRLSLQARTELSGNRDVPYKTTFPGVLKLILNELVMYPFHLLQKMNSGNARSLVIYTEFGAA